ncbi:MAG: type II secretion system secretin GspD [Pseudomonadota bacterium]|nr:type II secretion system secretin GspD [Pseudomonadota bacterium]
MKIHLSLFLLILFWPIMSYTEEITLNFKDTDINDLINVISEVTAKTFVVDPRVKAKVTVVSHKPLNRDEVYKVFLSILSVHGFSAVESGAVTKIIPDSQARAENVPVTTADNTLERGGDALVTQIVQVNHISAPQLVPLLRPMVNQQGHLVAYPANNTLIISDRAHTVKRLLEIIQRVDQPHEENIEVIVLKHAAAAEVVRILTLLEQKKSATAEGNEAPLTVVADERTNSVLLSGDTTTRVRLRTLITHLDTPVHSSGNTQVIYLRYAQAKDLVKVLKGVSDSLAEQEGSSATEEQAKTQNALKTHIQADESTNSLVITATPAVFDNLRAVIRQLDIRRAQVLVEAIIAEVSSDMARELGVQWLFYDTQGTAPVGVSNFDNAGSRIVDLAALAADTTRLTNLTPGAFLGLGRFNHAVFNFAVLLRALASDTQSNVLSTPSLLTLDNQEAEIHVGQNVPFVTGQYTNTGQVNDGVTNPFQTIQREDIGLKLKVKPQINEGNAVKLEIEQEVSSISNSATAADVITNKRTIKTTVIVEDGNMVVLGGLIDEDLQQTAQKVPVLGDIPLLGALFRSQSTQKIKRNLMVFLHPLIVRDPQTETLISSGKYGYMRDKQLTQKAQGLPLMSAEEIPVLPNLDDFLTVLPGDDTLLPPSPAHQ